jgi:hypothetical protein
MSDPIPFWRSDRDYFGLKDARREPHVRQIELHARIDQRIDVSAADGSYAVLVTRKDMAP